jgi:hypothetical protein
MNLGANRLDDTDPSMPKNSRRAERRGSQGLPGDRIAALAGFSPDDDLSGRNGVECEVLNGGPIIESHKSPVLSACHRARLLCRSPIGLGGENRCAGSHCASPDEASAGKPGLSFFSLIHVRVSVACYNFYRFSSPAKWDGRRLNRSRRLSVEVAVFNAMVGTGSSTSGHCAACRVRRG